MKSSAVKREVSPAPFLVPRRATKAEMHERELGKGVLAGLVGGLIGTVVMTAFQNVWSKAAQALKSDQSGSQSKAEQSESEDTTMKAVGKIAALAGRQLSHEQKKTFGPLVHYSFGTLQGGAYGGVTELTGVDGGFVPGLLLGAALFAVADEIAVPALGLSGKPTEFPLSSHVYGLASHLVYGVSTEIARRGLRAAI